MFSPADVRPILKNYHNKDIPAEFARFEAEAKRKEVEDWERRRGNSTSVAGAGWLGGMITGAVSLPPSNRNCVDSS